MTGVQRVLFRSHQEAAAGIAAAIATGGALAICSELLSANQLTLLMLLGKLKLRSSRLHLLPEFTSLVLQNGYSKHGACQFHDK